MEAINSAVKKIKVWVFAATAPGCAFATEASLNSLHQRSHGLKLDLCLSVQTSKDEEYLRSSYPDANVFYPNLNRIECLKNKPRYRSAIHSEILNESWKMKTDSDFAIIMDNDVILTGSQELNDLFNIMKSNQAVIFGTSFPKQNFLSRLIGHIDFKPLGVPNLIFSLLDLSYYKKFYSICDFGNLMLDSKNTFFDDSAPKKLQGKMIDTAAKLYIQPIIEKRKYITFSCINSFHPYFPGSMKNFFFGGVDSPELYSFKGIDLNIHHFKKLSSPSFKDTKDRKEAYESWKLKITRAYS
ncbi:MAG: hypothetical protein ISQ46_05165 [Methylophilaceae bacterium]|nr:hypothetical protein [Methylophilaceae bacterium]